MFLRVSILTLSTIFLLDCGGNVQTGWYLFASINFDLFYFSIGLWWKCLWYLFLRVSILTLSTIFLLDCGGNVQTGGICLLVYQF